MEWEETHYLLSCFHLTQKIIENNNVDITWKTASEINNDLFEIQKSDDAINWTTWKTVYGVGNSSSVVEYEAVDLSPYQGTTYYRLKQIDFDGTETIFDPVAVTLLALLDNISLYPNPSQGQVTFKVADEIGIDELRIIDLSGNTVFYEKMNNEVSVLGKDLRFLGPGIYVVTITTVSGNTIQDRLVII